MRYRGRRRNELSTRIGRHVSVKSSLGLAVVGLGLVVACSSGEVADAASVDQAAVLQSNLGNGVRLWRADREGQPLYLSVDLGGWGAVFHVGNETAPDAELLLSLAAKLEGMASENGVVLTNYEPDFFTTYLSDPHSENQVHLAANQCVREVVPDAGAVQHPVHGDLIRGPGYASWCDHDADIEVMAYGDDQFVKRVVSGMALVRNRQTNP